MYTMTYVYPPTDARQAKYQSLSAKLGEIGKAQFDEICVMISKATYEGLMQVYYTKYKTAPEIPELFKLLGYEVTTSNTLGDYKISWENV